MSALFCLECFFVALNCAHFKYENRFYLRLNLSSFFLATTPEDYFLHELILVTSLSEAATYGYVLMCLTLRPQCVIYM